ncbi:MAG: glucans biosynthesis glucosyltransferase MdoH [Nevskiaceae bacterium]|jgi:membrane glycosyltransferase|nr:glucans biosynthesis glucosyltransferase MdoH [Nevskiaceae bacterium]
MPAPAPLPMPEQDLTVAPELAFATSFGVHSTLARIVAIAGTLGILAYGTSEMVAIVRNEMTALQGLMIVFFAVTLGWIAQASASAVAGLLPLRRLPMAPAPGEPGSTAHRTALVMPIYNEDALRTTMAMRAMAEDLQAQGMAEGFEIVLLSDSTRPDPWIRESLAVTRLRESLSDVMPVWYRRRWENIGRKAGNMQEFVERWGARYDYMVILDADSLMEARTLVRLVRAMQADPSLGLLQTVPRLVGRNSLFARVQQFSGAIFGPVMARGVSAWAGDDGNYWGHNAILRVEAFASACGLPMLEGRKPFGGHILSHDFVEAALMRRAGWKVRMADGIGGSYEESPPSLIDLAIRDRRWAQGNLQHAKVLGAVGLRWHSRVHFAFGIMSYLSSPLWLLLLVTGFALSVQAGLNNPEYFSMPFQLFPNWPRFDSQRMLHLFGFSAVVLFLPKTIGFVKAMLTTRIRGTLGAVELIASTALEVVLSTLYAPVLMLMQSRYVLEILTGRDAGWSSQRRSEGQVTWGEAWRFHWGHTLAGVVLGALFALLAPKLLPWLSPVLVGLLLAVPLSKCSGSIGVGRALRRIGLLCTPEEEREPGIVRRRDQLVEQAVPMPEDGLRALATDARARAAQLQINLPPPSPSRGRPDADRLTAEQKLRDARTLEEALDWLTPRERIHVASDVAMLERLGVLAGRIT